MIHADGRGVVSELAFARGGRIEPHANPNTTWFIVIEGGGWVGVGDERTRVAAGEAVFWPADMPHAAWTEHSEMRAFVVEFAGPDDAAIRGILEGAGPTRSSGRRSTARRRRPGACSTRRRPAPAGAATREAGEPA